MARALADVAHKMQIWSQSVGNQNVGVIESRFYGLGRFTTSITEPVVNEEFTKPTENAVTIDYSTDGPLRLRTKGRP